MDTLTSHCSEIREHLSAYLDGEVTPSERLLVEKHLQSCLPCKEHHQSMARVVALAGELPEATASPTFCRDLTDRIARDGDRSPGLPDLFGSWMSDWTPVLAPLGAAAAVILVTVSWVQHLGVVSAVQDSAFGPRTAMAPAPVALSEPPARPVAPISSPVVASRPRAPAPTVTGPPAGALAPTAPARIAPDARGSRSFSLAAKAAPSPFPGGAPLPAPMIAAAPLPPPPAGTGLPGNNVIVTHRRHPVAPALQAPDMANTGPVLAEAPPPRGSDLPGLDFPAAHAMPLPGADRPRIDRGATPPRIERPAVPVWPTDKDPLDLTREMLGSIPVLTGEAALQANDDVQPGYLWHVDLASGVRFLEDLKAARSALGSQVILARATSTPEGLTLEIVSGPANPDFPRSLERLYEMLRKSPGLNGIAAGDLSETGNPSVARMLIPVK